MNIKEILIVGVACVIGIIFLHYFFHFADWLFETVIELIGLWTLLFIFAFGCFLGVLMQKWPEDSKF